MEDEQTVGAEDVGTLPEGHADEAGAQGEAGAEKPKMSLAELIAAAKTGGDQKLEQIGRRGEKPDKSGDDSGPRKPTTAEAFAEALKMVGEGNFITVQGACLIMEHNGWVSKSRSERDKYTAIKSAVYNRKRSGEERPELALPIDHSKSGDGLYAYKPIPKDAAEAAEGDEATQAQE